MKKLNNTDRAHAINLNENLSKGQKSEIKLTKL